MTNGIIDLFEPVKIYEQKTDLATFAPGVYQLLG